MPSILTLRGPQFGAATQPEGFPPSLEEQQQIAGCVRVWEAYPNDVILAQALPGARCTKTNFTTPTSYRNFYRDVQIEKLYSPVTKLVMVIPNNPTWLQRGWNWLLQNCNYAAVAAGVLSPGAAAAGAAACRLVNNGGGGGGSSPAPAPDGGGQTFTPTKKMSTGAKVAIGVGATAAVGGVVALIVSLARR